MGRERRKKEKKSYLRAKKNLVRDHSFMTSAISTYIEFWSKDNLILDVLNWYSITPGSFGISLKTLWDQHSDVELFSLLMHIIITVLKSIIKLTGKSTEFHQADFWGRLIYMQCLHYRTTSQVQKIFQDGNSANFFNK